MEIFGYLRFSLVHMKVSKSCSLREGIGIERNGECIVKTATHISVRGSCLAEIILSSKKMIHSN